MRSCTTCGEATRPGTRFCIRCGTVVPGATGLRRCPGDISAPTSPGSSFERTVIVTGEIGLVWPRLLECLARHRYVVREQRPGSTLVARRGSRLSSFLFEGTKSGFREVHVFLRTLVDPVGTIEVRFAFEFPSWAFTLPGTRSDCLQMVDELEGRFEPVAPAIPSPRRTGPEALCPTCGVELSRDAAFCGSCGRAIPSAARPYRASA